MSDMKCPFCRQELLLTSYRDGDKDNEIWNCLHCQIGGKRKLWQELIKLMEENERTRKALEITTDAIDKILVLDSGKFCKEPAEMWKIAKSAKDKITALEQKE